MEAETIEATNAAHYLEFGILVREYTAWLLQLLGSEAWFMENVLKAQSLEAELENLEKIYSPPSGRVLLAEVNGKIAGGVAMRKLSGGVCEMKRMYLRGQYRGAGLGRQLCAAIIAAARSDGCRLLRLDTARRLTEAIALYRSLGFVECEPYRNYPEKLLPHLLFMELALPGGLAGIA